MFEIGSSLREARLRQALDLNDAEQATKIRSKYLRALEDERFDLLPAETYVKGFLRSYAEYLGLDGQLYVDEYNSRYVTGEDEAPPRARRRPTSRSERRVESGALLFALAGIAAAAGLVVAAWRYGGSEEARIPNLGEAAPTTPAASRPRQRPRPVVRPPRGTAWIALDVRAARGNSTLNVYRVVAGDRKLLFGGTLERGKSMRFTGARLWLNVSHPENLTLRLNKRPYRIPGLGNAPTVLVADRRGIAPARG